MLTKNHPMDSDVTSSNLILTNTISEKLIETHELVFQGLKLLFRLAVTVGKCHDDRERNRTILVFVDRVGLPNNACYVLHCVVSTIEQGWMMDNQRKFFTKHARLHYLDVMAINFVLQLYMSDVSRCPSITYKHILRFVHRRLERRMNEWSLRSLLDAVCTCVYWKCNAVRRRRNSI